MQSLPNDLQDLLDALRQRIQRYVWLEGMALLAIIVGGFFWVTLGLDWAYFQLQSADLPRWVRFSLEAIAGGLCAMGFVLWVALRSFRHFRRRALALVLERRFPELNDRLITAVEMAEQPQMSLLTQNMLQRTTAEVRDLLGQLELGQVFDRRPLLRATLGAAFLIATVTTFACANTGTFQLWFSRNVLLRDAAWNRETAVRVRVIAEPGERFVEFRDGVYKHPRGADLVLLVDVLPDKRVPQQVQLRYWQTDGASRGRAYLARYGQNQFRHTLSGVLSSFDFQLIAGDAERIPLHVEVVDPPRLDQVELECLFPDYTGLNAKNETTGKVERTPKPVLGTQLSLPAGTDFTLNAKANKSLTGVRLSTTAFELEIAAEQAKLTFFQGSGPTAPGKSYVIPNSSGWLNRSGPGFQLPATLGAPGFEQMVSSEGVVKLPLALPPESDLKIWLSDTDDIRSQEPIRLSLNAIPDDVPAVQTQLRGIGSSITRKAVIPMIGEVTDDYGVVEARFEYRLDAATEFSPRPLPVSPNGAKSFPLKQSDKQPWLRFDVLPLELKVNQKMTLSLYAQDGDSLFGPHGTRGEQFTFQVVSEEELMSQLLAREMNLSLRFEQILLEVQKTQADLVVARKSIQELLEKAKNPTEKPQNPDQSAEVRGTILASVERALYGLRKNHNENQAVEQSLSDIRQEMVNNAVDTPENLHRLDEQLLEPLQLLNAQDFPEVDQRLGLFRLAWQEDRATGDVLDEILVSVDRLRRRMEQILTEMRRLETYKKLLERLKTIKTQQEELKKRTEAENKKSLIEKLQ